VILVFQFQIIRSYVVNVYSQNEMEVKREEAQCFLSPIHFL